MRVFKNFEQARNEIRRDLNELGIEVFAGYQSKALEDLDRAEFTTKELQNYGFIVIQPKQEDLVEHHLTWCPAEWEERLQGIQGNPLNPGTAYHQRPEIWDDLLEHDVKFDEYRFAYSYGERFARAGVLDMVKAFKENPASRQIYISIWDPILDGSQVGKHRVPCSLGYHLVQRGGRVDMTYHMRSSDFSNHWDNDCWLALALQNWFCEEVGYRPGTFSMLTDSLHVYAKDVAGVF